MCLPLRLTLTSPTSRNTRRCFETEGCSKPSLLTMSPTGRSPSARNSRISRRRGSATALNPSEVVDARAMHEIIYSDIGMCQTWIFDVRSSAAMLQLNLSPHCSLCPVTVTLMSTSHALRHCARGIYCGSGGTGRHTILRGWRRKAWGFKSPLPHQALILTQRKARPAGWVWFEQ